jgi:predicted CXXCH cytochrome family protein
MGRRTAVVCSLVLLVWLALGATVAQAYDENQPLPPFTGVHRGAVESECKTCHPSGRGDCFFCHIGTREPEGGKGPHGLYATTTNRCASCHEAHDANGATLLPAATVSASCATCHDGTGGGGVYGTIVSRGLTVGAQHRVDQVSSVPGGDAATGGSAAFTFGGPGGTLSCSDCHSPHDSNTVAPFEHERRRTIHDVMGWNGNPANSFPTNRLLRQKPANAATAVASYGSDWCLACHAGRNAGGAVHNHPVDSLATNATPFIYNSVAILNSNDLTAVTVLGTMGYTNRGYLMPYPRTAQQAGHAPICQQCHEDSRSVGALSAAGNEGDAATYVTNSDMTTLSVSADNPRFQNFPHETVNAKMTVETDDDLCLNCHPTTALP